MNLANIETILRIILIALKIAILVEYIPKKHKKNRSNHRKDER